MSKAHREYFNQIAPEWNDKVTYLPLLKEYMIRFGVLAGDRVLDIGAGTGRLTEQLIDLVGPRGFVIGADIAENMLCYAKAHLDGRQSYLTCADVCTLSFYENSFDKVVCFSTFPHFHKPMRALKEMHRVLHPGGKCLILHTCCSNALNTFHASLNGIVCKDMLPSSTDMAPMLRSAGFSHTKILENEDIYWIEAMKPRLKVVNP